MYQLKRKINHINRTILLDGSPANRVAKWALTFLITGTWIYHSEKKNPKQRGIFFRDKTAKEFLPHEITEWNARFKNERI